MVTFSKDNQIIMLFVKLVNKHNPLVLYKVSNKLYDMMGEYWDQIIAETI